MSAFENAKLLARIMGVPVFPSSRRLQSNESNATTDMRTLDRFNAADENAVWLARCGCQFGLMALDAPAVADFESLVAELGEPPRTMRVSRASGTGVVRWFLVDPGTPEIRLGQKLRNTRATFRRSVVIPDSFHPASGEQYEVMDGKSFEVRHIATLPDFWIQELARSGVTANVMTRPEWNREDFLRGFE